MKYRRVETPLTAIHKYARRYYTRMELYRPDKQMRVLSEISLRTTDFDRAVELVNHIRQVQKVMPLLTREDVINGLKLG